MRSDRDDFPGLSSLVIEQMLDHGMTVHVVARTSVVAVACPECGQLSDRVHAYHQRCLAERWARRTRQLTALVADLAVVTAGRAGAAPLARVGARLSRSTVLRVLMATAIPRSRCRPC